jgi:hypothetical protein
MKLYYSPLIKQEINDVLYVLKKQLICLVVLLYACKQSKGIFGLKGI